MWSAIDDREGWVVVRNGRKGFGTDETYCKWKQERPAQPWQYSLCLIKDRLRVYLRTFSSELLVISVRRVSFV